MVDDDEFDETLTVGRSLAAQLADASSRVAELLREHIEDNDEVLPTIFLGDVAKWFVEACAARAGQQVDIDEARRVVSILERDFVGASETVTNMIAVGFVEMLPVPNAAGSECVNELPRPLQDEYIRMQNWYPQS